MVEYVEEDAVALKGALQTLILKCTEEMCNSLDCTITFGGLALDCHFDFQCMRRRKNDQNDRI